MVASMNSLRIEISVSSEPGAGSETVVNAAVHPIVDGRNVIADAFDAGPGHAPERLLPPHGPLHTGEEPHEVELAEADCTWGCCGALCVTIRRVGDQVVWDGWRNRNGPAPDLPAFRFDADQYNAEIARAEKDYSWEWPARTLARLLSERLRIDPEEIGRWNFDFHSASSWRPDEVDVLLGHPRGSTDDGPWLQFRKILTVTDEDPAVQAARFGAELIDNDPRGYTEICGGSAEFARELGFPWPPNKL
ncbi:hypothetical protein IU476_22185 [Nocardia blacklockiae]|nr:hypothetical protein [Nocardia blacklockiae]